MSANRQWKFLIDPLSGNLVFVPVPISAGEGGGIVTTGNMLLPSGTSVQFIGGVAIQSAGETSIEPGSEIRILP